MNTTGMNFKLILLLVLLRYSSAQDANCDYYQNVLVGGTYYVYSPNYASNYPPGVQCRWIATCPQGYNCRLNCSDIRLPQSPSCSGDRLLVSLSGDPQLSGAATYCGVGSLDVTSTGQTISIGLISSRSSPGGRFFCELKAQLATPAPRCSCGERKEVRIVGGQETAVNEYKMMAGLADKRISEIKCGAVIISQMHVLTAAHCVVNQSVNDYAVVVGEHDVTTGDSPATKAYRISKFTTHPLFSAVNYDYDIAIATVTNPIEFSSLVGPVCLPFKFVNTDFTGRKVTILGWGTLIPGGPKSRVLMKADLNVTSQSFCRSKVPSVTPRQICTFTPGKDACQDDSGGPALYNDPATGLLFNLGIISFGRFCASDEPGINTRVTVLLDWIVANTMARDRYCMK